MVEICVGFLDNKLVLLYGVIGSGKIWVYIELIQEIIDWGEQVLYLLLEIVLIMQIVFCLEWVFGDDIIVYYSCFNNNEWVEFWNSVFNGKFVFLGVCFVFFCFFLSWGLLWLMRSMIFFLSNMILICGIMFGMWLFFWYICMV